MRAFILIETLIFSAIVSLFTYAVVSDVEGVRTHKSNEQFQSWENL